MSSTPPPASDIDSETPAGENKLMKCLLSQYRFSAAGVSLGTAYSLRFKRGLTPMLAAGAIGTSADMVYGYLVACAQYREPWTVRTPRHLSDESSSSTK